MLMSQRQQGEKFQKVSETMINHHNDVDDVQQSLRCYRLQFQTSKSVSTIQLNSFHTKTKHQLVTLVILLHESMQYDYRLGNNSRVFHVNQFVIRGLWKVIFLAFLKKSTEVTNLNAFKHRIYTYNYNYLKICMCAVIISFLTITLTKFVKI